jgi:hypothetical protein
VLVVPPLLSWLALLVLLFLVWGGAMGLGALLGGLMGGPAGAAALGVGGFVVGFVLFTLVFSLVKVLAHGVVIIMARDALAGREPAMGEALGAVLARLLDVLVAAFLMWLVITVGFFLLFIPGLIASFLLLLTPAAVLLDGLGPVDGMRRSIALVRANLLTVGGFAIGVVLVAAAALIVGGILGAAPVVGGLAAAIVGGAVVSYLTVVGVRLYQALPDRS